MVRTFDFVFSIQRDEGLRDQIYELLNSKEDSNYDIKGWHLFFDHNRKVVVITSNGIGDYLKSEFVPAEVVFDSLISVMDPAKHNDSCEFKMRFLN